MDQLQEVLATGFKEILSGTTQTSRWTPEYTIQRYPSSQTLSPFKFKLFRKFLEAGGRGEEWFEDDRPCDVKSHPFGSEEFWKSKLAMFGFGELFIDKSFDQIKAKHPQHTKTLWSYLQEIDRYVDGDHKGIGVVLAGPVGTLKTTMLWLFAKMIVLRYAKLRKPHPMIKYVKYHEVAKRLSQERFSNYGGPGYSNSLSNIDVLMIDDFAPFGIMQHESEELFEIFDARWREKRITFVATNQDEEWLQANLPQVKDRWNTSLLLRFDGASERRLSAEVEERLGMND